VALKEVTVFVILVVASIAILCGDCGEFLGEKFVPKETNKQKPEIHQCVCVCNFNDGILKSVKAIPRGDRHFTYTGKQFAMQKKSLDVFFFWQKSLHLPTLQLE